MDEVVYVGTATKRTPSGRRGSATDDNRRYENIVKGCTEGV
jgi:hypothetical protein